MHHFLKMFRPFLIFLPTYQNFYCLGDLCNLSVNYSIMLNCGGTICLPLFIGNFLFCCLLVILRILPIFLLEQLVYSIKTIQQRLRFNQIIGCLCESYYILCIAVMNKIVAQVYCAEGGYFILHL